MRLLLENTPSIAVSFQVTRGAGTLSCSRCTYSPVTGSLYVFCQRISRINGLSSETYTPVVFGVWSLRFSISMAIATSFPACRESTATPYRFVCQSLCICSW